MQTSIDVVASRQDKRIFLQVVNTNHTHSVTASLSLDNAVVQEAAAYAIADDPMVEVSELNCDEVMQVSRSNLSTNGRWTFPAASVTAVELVLAS